MIKKSEIFDIDELIKTETIPSIINKLCLLISDSSNNYGFKTLMTNGNLGAMLQNNLNFKPTNISTIVSAPYMFGKLFNIQIFVDPFMRWDDNRIILTDVPIKFSRKRKINIIYNKSDIEPIDEYTINVKDTDAQFF